MTIGYQQRERKPCQKNKILFHVTEGTKRQKDVYHLP